MSDILIVEKDNVQVLQINEKEIVVIEKGFSIVQNGGGSSEWGGITGNLSDQTDLKNALDNKQDILVSGNNIKTINGNSILGSGDLVISGGGGGAVDSVNGQVGVVVLDADDISDTTTANKFVTVAEKTNIADSVTHIANTSNPHSTTKAQVGLGNVDNTSDLNKPVSTATQTALNLKEAIANKNSPNGYCGLDSNGKVDISRMPASALERMVYVTEFLENPTAPDVASGDNSTKVANTNFVSTMLGGNTVPAKALSANGYVKMANGLILQWGTTSAVSRDNPGVTINFPIAFPDACFSVTATFTAHAVSGQGTQGVSSISKASFVVFNGQDVAGSFRWIAIGY